MILTICCFPTQTILLRLIVRHLTQFRHIPRRRCTHIRQRTLITFFKTQVQCLLSVPSQRPVTTIHAIDAHFGFHSHSGTDQPFIDISTYAEPDGFSTSAQLPFRASFLLPFFPRSMDTLATTEVEHNPIILSRDEDGADQNSVIQGGSATGTDTSLSTSETEKKTNTEANPSPPMYLISPHNSTAFNPSSPPLSAAITTIKSYDESGGPHHLFTSSSLQPLPTTPPYTPMTSSPSVSLSSPLDSSTLSTTFSSTPSVSMQSSLPISGSESSKLASNSAQPPTFTLSSLDTLAKSMAGSLHERCYHCGQFGHVFAKCPYHSSHHAVVAPRRHVSRSSCYRCGREGHTSKECTFEDTRICFLCKKVGHVAKECPFSTTGQQK